MGAVNKLLFQPPDVSYVHAKNRSIWLRNASNIEIPGFLIEKRSKIFVLFSHGNAEDLGMVYDFCCDFAEKLQVNMLAYDYTGYGHARLSGDPTETACYEDISAAYKYLVDQVQVAPANIIVFGRSLGSGPSTYLVERLQSQDVTVGGLVLQSPFMSVFRVAFSFRFTLPWDMFPNIDRIPTLSTCPIFIIHGTRDEIVPFQNGERLFLAAPISVRAKPAWIDGGGHNNLESTFQTEYFLCFREFLLEWVPVYSSTAVS